MSARHAHDENRAARHVARRKRAHLRSLLRHLTVRTFPDGSPCWCYSPGGEEPHEGWSHSLGCSAAQEFVAEKD